MTVLPNYKAQRGRTPQSRTDGRREKGRDRPGPFP